MQLPNVTFHLFYDCSFAAGCWNHVGLMYDWSQVEFAPDWLLQKLSNAPAEELVKICIIMWGIWHWRNKRVWDGKVVTAQFAMDSSFLVYSEWSAARQRQGNAPPTPSGTDETIKDTTIIWKPPANAILGNSLNLLEAGEVIESCRISLASLRRVLICFIWKNVNKVAHGIAEIPYLFLKTLKSLT